MWRAAVALSLFLSLVFRGEFECYDAAMWTWEGIVKGESDPGLTGVLVCVGTVSCHSVVVEYAVSIVG